MRFSPIYDCRFLLRVCPCDHRKGRSFAPALCRQPLFPGTWVSALSALCSASSSLCSSSCICSNRERGETLVPGPDNENWHQDTQRTDTMLRPHFHCLSKRLQDIGGKILHGDSQLPDPKLTKQMKRRCCHHCRTRSPLCRIVGHCPNPALIASLWCLFPVYWVDREAVALSAHVPSTDHSPSYPLLSLVRECSLHPKHLPSWGNGTYEYPLT